MRQKRGYLPVDLHLHSTASDGLLTPGELIARAAAAGLAAVALTDHDTLEGVEEALAAGRRWDLEVLPGVEISASSGEREIHLLGYDPLFPEKINSVLENLRRGRYRRMEKMLFLLRGLGINITFEEVASEAGRAAPGRLHLARLMAKRGHTADTDAAFSLYLEQGRPAFVPRRILDPAQAIKLLHQGGAVPVLAHPGPAGRGELRELVDLGLRGVEVIHPLHPPDLVRYYRHRARQMGLLITGGSDYHGGERSVRMGDYTVPYRCLTALKKYPRDIQ